MPNMGELNLNIADVEVTEGTRLMEYDEDIERIFTFHPVAEGTDNARAHDNVRMACKNLAYELANLCPDNMERMRAIEALDDTMKHANASIARG